MKQILLGVSSSISMYKSLDLISYLKKHQVFCKTILTPHASKLISPDLFTSLSGEASLDDTFAKPEPGTMWHIDWARDAALYLIAPATATTLARLAHGLGEDLLSTAYLAATCPVLIAPAMNPSMFQHPAVQANLQILRERGHIIIEPESGVVACGEEGQGKLASVEKLAATVLQVLENQASHSSLMPRVLVTSGGSREPVDPVREITNRSSGKMGASLAEAFARQGCAVSLLEGSVQYTTEMALIKKTAFRNNSDLESGIEKLMPEHDILVMAAAPADFEAAEVAERKIKSNTELSLKLKKTRDILAHVSKESGKLYVGFAAETENLLENASKKLEQKGIQLIVANPVGAHPEGNSMGGNKSRARLLSKKGLRYESPWAQKEVVAEKLAIEILNSYKESL